MKALLSILCAASDLITVDDTQVVDTEMCLDYNRRPTVAFNFGEGYTQIFPDIVVDAPDAVTHMVAEHGFKAHAVAFFKRRPLADEDLKPFEEVLNG